MGDNYKGKGSAGFYAGADYGFDPNYGKEFSLGLSNEYRFAPSEFGFTTDPRSANQISAVSQKLNTGAKTIEVTAIQPQILESIPKQHFKEINRLKKLVGTDLTFHGPLIEPTGVSGQGGWNPAQREFAEKQLWSSVERAHDLEPDGNIIITFHSSNGLPPPETEIIRDGKKVVDSISVIDEDTGQLGALPRSSKDYFEGEKEYNPYTELKRLNGENWTTRLSNINVSAARGRDVFDQLRELKEKTDEKLGLDAEKLYKIWDTPEGETLKKNLNEEEKNFASKIVNNMSFAGVQAYDSYRMFKDAFNKAYSVAERNKDKVFVEKLDKLAEEITPEVNMYKEDNSKVIELTNAVTRGIQVLKSIDAPQTFQPLRGFAIDKASETFGNLAFDAYKKFKNTAPIISIENPPVGMGLTRGEDLRELVAAAREKFVDKAVDKLGMSQSEAERQAEKLIGVTWDVGHINMLRKYGFEDKHIEKETEKVAEVVKHIHLSDNFGYEHTELPMGMGNVPMKGHLEALKKHGAQLSKIKKIVETGNWFEPFKFTPVRETLSAFGSPIYSMQMAPYWNQAAHAGGGYFAGYGRMLPEQHFNLYGSGFSNLPVELGGQMTGRSRASGAPID